MGKENKQMSKLTLVALILMIFTSVFGFNNIPRAFYLMGYSAIPWYLFGAIAFFIPYAFMMAEYGAAFKEEKGRSDPAGRGDACHERNEDIGAH